MSQDKKTAQDDYSPFPTSAEDRKTYIADIEREATPQTRSPSYRLAFDDIDFLTRRELRAARLQLEMLKPELAFQDEDIVSTIVVFGSARICDQETAKSALTRAENALAAAPGDRKARQAARQAKTVLESSKYYDEAREFGRLVSEKAKQPGHRRYVITTGGGPGIMEAANRGAHDCGAKSVGLSIVLPHEQAPNAYITPELSFNFHYFAIRKMHFLIRAEALACFPGGFGTLDELFEALTLIQTGKIQHIPILLFGADWWRRIIDFEALADAGTISREDLNIFQFVETAQEGWRAICEYYRRNPHPNGWAAD